MIQIDTNEVMTLIEVAWNRYNKEYLLDTAIRDWYPKLADHERKRIYEWAKRVLYSDCFPKNDRQKRFMARFNPENQYNVKTEYKGAGETMEGYLYDGKYWLNERTVIAEEYIVEVAQIKQEVNNE